MNLLTVAEQLSEAMDRPPITFDARRCLRGRSKNAGCDACVTACPVGAIHLDRPVVFDADACKSCGLCLHRCPVGAFEGQDGTADLLNCASRLNERESIELVCAAHPSSDHGPRAADAVIRVSGCLAAPGPSAYAGLAALGARNVTVRLDACTECLLGNTHAETLQTVNDANRILLAWSAHIAVLDTGPARGWKKSRIVYDAKHPPISRRTFFRRLAAQDTPGFAVDDPPAGAKAPPRERRRLLHALACLPASESTMLERAPFVQITASEACTACGVCDRVCPVGAIKLDTSGDQFQLTFSAGRCTDCGLCLEFCQPQALRRDRLPSLPELLNVEPMTLWQGSLRRCSKCGAKFAGEIDLCPPCEFRRLNPFQGRRL